MHSKACAAAITAVYAVHGPGRLSPHAATPVLILTPIKDGVRSLPRYLSRLTNLTRVHEHGALSLGLLDSDSSDTPPPKTPVGPCGEEWLAAHPTARLTGTLHGVLAALPKLYHMFQEVTVLQHDFGLVLSRTARHDLGVQAARRAVLARARNHLLYEALRPRFEYVLWLDADLGSYPRTLCLSLLSAQAPCVVPNVVVAPGGRSYDLNSWRDPELGATASVGEAANWHDRKGAGRCASVEGCGRVEMEGYGEGVAGGRHVYLSSLRTEAAAAIAEWQGKGEAPPGAGAVRLDGVGGGALLVSAELHRHGLNFPPGPVRGRVETEGLAMAALDYEAQCVGLPLVEVVHK